MRGGLTRYGDCRVEHYFHEINAGGAEPMDDTNDSANAAWQRLADCVAGYAHLMAGEVPSAKRCHDA